MVLRTNAQGGVYINGAAYDVRKRHDVLRVWQANPQMSFKEIGDMPGICLDFRTVRRWVCNFVNNSILAPLPTGGLENAPPILDWSMLFFLKALVKLCPDLYLWEYADELAINLLIPRPSESTVDRALVFLKLTRKKRVAMAEEKFNMPNMLRYGLHLLWMRTLTPATTVVCLDEFGYRDTDCHRPYARGPSGQRVVIVDKYVKGTKWNIATCCYAGGPLVNTTWGFPNGIGLGDGFRAPIFNWYFANIVLPSVIQQLGQGVVIIMDNASFHQKYVLTAMANAVGVGVRFVAAFSPELNPAELFIGYIKTTAMGQWVRNENVDLSYFTL